MGWFIGIIIYLLIGIALLAYIVNYDKYGGIVLHLWWSVVFLYPYLIARTLFSRKKLSN